MATDPRLKELEAVLSWHLEPDSVLRQLLQWGFCRAFEHYSAVELTMGDCAAFLMYLHEVFDRYRFDDPAPEVAQRWVERLYDGNIHEAYVEHDYAEKRYVALQRDLLRVVWDNRGVPRERRAAIHLTNFFHFVWHVLADDGQLIRWHQNVSKAG